jgi:hypothetical protein
VIGYLIANVIFFYKGAVSYECAKNMPILELFELSEYGAQINKEIEKQSKQKL